VRAEYLGNMALWHIVVGLMTFWIIVLLLMGSSLHQSSDVSEQVDRQLFEAMLKLDELKKENKQLKRIAADLKYDTEIILPAQFTV
jgi:cell division protein FtsB